MKLILCIMAGAAISAVAMALLVGTMTVALKLGDAAEKAYNARFTGAKSILSVHWRHWPGMMVYMGFLFGIFGAIVGVVAYFGTGSAA